MKTLSEGSVIVPAEGVKSVQVFGIRVDFLLSSEDTRGAYSTYRVHVEPGAGSPPHLHRLDDEAFYILEGRFEVLCGQTVSFVEAGAFVFLPRNVPHYFRNAGTAPGLFLGVCTPAGHERFFEDVHSLGPDPQPVEAEAVCRKHGIELVNLG